MTAKSMTFRFSLLEPEKQVSTYQQSVRLKQIGVKQNSLLFWIGVPPVLRTLSDAIKFFPRSETIMYSAFTVAELGVLLPDYCVSWVNGLYGHKQHPEYKNKWLCDLQDNYSKIPMNLLALGKGDTEAEARAAMLIYLLESKKVINKMAATTAPKYKNESEAVILDGNKLIAEFMEVEFGNRPDKRLAEDLWLKFNESNVPLNCSYNWALSAAQYHKSWDWLMPVVEKIEKLPLQHPTLRGVDYCNLRTFWGYNPQAAGLGARSISYAKFKSESDDFSYFSANSISRIFAVWYAVVGFLKTGWQRKKPETNK